MRKIKIARNILIIAILFVICCIIFKLNKKSNKLIVCIDAGHGGSDVGAIYNDRYEKKDTLEVAKLVKKYLEEENIKVIMTRNEDKTIELKQRCNIANRKKANLFISIHRNSGDDGKGIELWVNNKKKKDDIELATNIINNLEKTEIQINRGIKYGTIKGEKTNYYVLGNTNMTSCLIELGFITNDKDNQLFEKNIEQYAKAIANGIIEKGNNQKKG